MKIQELKSLVREEVRKIVTEAAVKLPKGIKITDLGNKRYAFEYIFSSSEPTIAQAEQALAMLRKEYAKISNTVQATKTTGEATIYVRNGNIAIGIDFASKLGSNAIADVVGGINYRD
jgi:hypothetical protein